uniref:PDEase domain-containing protein n=1 Tax=Chlamydomonas euryale TaxID=1486919 RepID=A0A7R9YVY4_9CHLO|mmetsp:Transcript_28705/g.84919  ORF Transcript_28705/g.84919 Transcript_28705/m.84919 type:complete len:259 (+) Transcript_28705:197-973(+)
MLHVPWRHASARSAAVRTQTPVAKLVLSMEEHAAVLVAALCHDLDHDGHSNSYHMHMQSELARLYNDISVMENHHCAMTFEVLRRPDCALFAHLGADAQRRVRKVIIQTIQCTDMTHHFRMTQDFCSHSLEFDPSSESDRLLLAKAILHGADIGNAARPVAVNDIMSTRVHREFELLAEEEERLGIPVTFSIESENKLMCAQMEVNFLDYIVMPLWEKLHEVLCVPVAMRNLRANREKYAALQEQLVDDQPGDELAEG